MENKTVEIRFYAGSGIVKGMKAVIKGLRRHGREEFLCLHDGSQIPLDALLSVDGVHLH